MVIVDARGGIGREKYPLALPNFTLISGNTPLEKAQVICFTDKHTDYVQSLNTAQIVRQLSRRGDSFLIEGDPYEKVLGEIKPGVIMRGWDDQSLMTRSKRLLRRFHLISLFLNKLQSTPVSESEKEASQRRQLRLINEMESSLGEVLGPLGQQRSSVLMGSIKRNQQERTGRTFVISGEAHLIGIIGIERSLQESGYRYVICSADGEEISPAEDARRAREHIRWMGKSA